MKKGAASFYIVAIATLILAVIAASFATLILNEMTRTSNDDLSQSAYDSAMAGVEDAKVALINYQRCRENGATAAATRPTGGGAVTCADIMYWVEHPECGSVARILGRIGKDDPESEVPITETTTTKGKVTNNLNQAYTCVMIDATTTDYRSSINSSNSERVVRVGISESQNPDDIEAVKISWYSNREGVQYYYSNYDYGNDGGRVIFGPVNAGGVSTPPTIALQMIQTAEKFNFSDFDVNVGNTTDRGTVYLVPFGDTRDSSGTKIDAKLRVESAIKNGNNEFGTYIYAKDNKIAADYLVKSNDKTTTNKPFLVFCDGNTSTEFACTATIYLPRPVASNGTTARNRDTFVFTISMPYEQPDTDFALEYICRSGVSCPGSTAIGNTTTMQNTASITGVQYRIDSTGRANDLFRRVETRMESADISFAYPYSAVQMLGNDNGGQNAVIQKNLENVTMP